MTFGCNAMLGRAVFGLTEFAKSCGSMISSLSKPSRRYNELRAFLESVNNVRKVDVIILRAHTNHFICTRRKEHTDRSEFLRGRAKGYFT